MKLQTTSETGARALIAGMLEEADEVDDRAIRPHVDRDTRVGMFGESFGLRRAARVLSAYFDLRRDCADHDLYYRPNGQIVCHGCTRINDFDVQDDGS